MDEKLSSVLESASYEELEQALEVKRREHIQRLQERRQNLIMERKNAIAEFDRQLAGLDAEVEKVSGKKPAKRRGRPVRSSGAVRSGSLTEAILRVFESNTSSQLPTKEILAALPSVGYDRDLDKANGLIGTYLARMCKRGQLERVSNGVFKRRQ